MPAQTTPPDRTPRVQARDFPGLATRIDPDDLDDGAGRDQVNLTSERPGQLRCRSGYQKLTFEEE